MTLTLYAIPMSTYCAKVRIILRLKSIDHLEIPPPGGTYKTDAYRAIVAAGSIPAIQSGAFVLHDSDAISEYLEDNYPDPAMRPENPQVRARLRSIARYHDTRLEPALRTLFGFIGRAKSSDKTKTALATLEDCLERLENLIDPSPYLWGDRLSLADCAYPTTLFMIQDVSAALQRTIELPDKVMAWRKALYNNVTISQIVDENRDAVSSWLISITESA
ncbi:uncharacterized protein METZ01_LOCUS216055 [marine metagenome]|uniref:GST N-terminal domain-containing protein n=1 Tax=marine metagenome TaxID=408172 RepID=A0A382FMK6_9ZZZZ